MRRLAVVLIAFAGFSCATVGSHFDKNGRERAAFDLNCRKEALEVSALTGQLDDVLLRGAQVGVRGCGNRAVYVFNPEVGWILNGSSVPSP